mmetsp:Transcript_58517/g.116036  ORF Transcript_58517/g.116036 Transcript_58517/m.116036 type:complete len:370 (+) Transcript_58517:72-1181(+)
MASSLDGAMGPGEPLDTNALRERVAARRQAEWDRQLQCVDQRQAELLGSQWKLVREQIGGLASDLAALQNQLRDFTLESRRAFIEMEAHARKNEQKILEETTLRVSKFHEVDSQMQALERNVQQFEVDLQFHRTQRSTMSDEIALKLETCSVAMDARAREQASQARELQHLRDEASANTHELEVLRDAFADEAADRRAAQASSADFARELRGRLVEEVERRTVSQTELTQSLQAAADREAAERSLSHATLSRAVNALESELLPIKKAVLGPCTPAGKQNGEIDCALQGFKASITHELAEQAEATRLESKEFCEDLRQSLDARIAGERVLHLGLLDRSLDEARQLALRSSAEQRREMLRAATTGQVSGHR